MDSTPHQICEKFLEYIEKEKLDPSLVIGDEDFWDAPKHPDQDVRMAWFYLMDKLMEIEPEVCISVLDKILTDPDQISFRTTLGQQILTP